MDQFAQSREDDDLFGDDFEPVPTPTIVAEDQYSSTQQGVGHNGTTSREGGQDRSRVGGTDTHRESRGRGGRGQGAHRGQGQERGRGRGRGGRGGQEGLAGSRYASAAPAQDNSTIPKPNAPAANLPPTLDTTLDTTTTDSATTTNDTNTVKTTNTTNDEKNPPSSEPAPPQTPTTNIEQPERSTRTTAVRGDRSLTGGPSHKKLSEAELSEKMARMAILNAAKSEKFRAAEADSAAFQQKEAEMKKKRVEEQKNAREMDKERARNRERKLKAQGGREWDSEKLESDIVDGKGRGRSSEYVRGGHGGVIRGGGLGGSRFAEGDTGGDDVGYQIRGRGGFEGRGRGRGRGGRGGKTTTPAVPTADDFPSLPTPAATPAKAPVPEETIKSPTEPGGHDWAEEMATPVEEKKMSV